MADQLSASLNLRWIKQHYMAFILGENECDIFCTHGLVYDNCPCSNRTLEEF